MAENRRNYAALGMLLGAAIAGGLGVVLFVLTRQAVYIAFSGVGAAVGLVLGAGYERALRQR